MAETQACLNVLSGATVGGAPSYFDNTNGSIYLLQADDCWAEVVAQVDEQLALAQIGLENLEALHLPTEHVAEAIAEIATTRDYSEGLMVFSSWQWDESLLEEGDDIGMCWYQDSGTTTENYAQCWAYRWSGGAYNSGESYALRPSELSDTSTLDDYDPVDATVQVGTKGSWIISGPHEAFETTKIAFTAKFSPKVNDRTDPIIKEGATEVVTYLSSRVSLTNAAEVVADVDTDFSLYTHPHLAQSRWSASPKWTAETVNLGCYTTIAAGYVPGCDYVPPPPPEPEPEEPVEDDDDDTTPTTPTSTGATALSMAGAILASASLLAF